MHIAVDEALSGGRRLAGELSQLARADGTLDAFPFAASPAWLSAQEVAELDSLGAALHVVLDGALHALRVRPELRAAVTPGPQALRWQEPPQDRRTAAAIAGWSTAMRWLHGPDRLPPVVRVRPDAFLIGGKLRIVELNVGMMLTHTIDALARVFEQHAGMRSMVEGKVPPRSSGALADALVGRARALVTDVEPRVAMLCSPGLKTRGHTEVLAALEATGAPVLTAGPFELSWRRGHLAVGRQRVTLAVDDGIPRSLAAFPAPARVLAKLHLMQAYLRRAAWVYPAPYEWVFAKAFMALLSAGSFDGLVQEAALGRVKTHLAWTRLTRAGHAQWRDGSWAELRELSERHRPDLVLKPVFGSQGKGVCFGDEVDRTAWNDRLNRAFADGDCVVQERLRPDPVDVVPCTPQPGKARVIHDMCPVFIDGRVEGVWCRYSSSSMTGYCYNQAHGTAVHGSLPTWLAERAPAAREATR